MKQATTIFRSPVRTIASVAGSHNRVSTMFFSILSSVVATARSCASTIRSSPPTIAIRAMDFGADSVTSRSGRRVMLPSISLRPSLLEQRHRADRSLRNSWDSSECYLQVTTERQRLQPSGTRPQSSASRYISDRVRTTMLAMEGV